MKHLTLKIVIAGLLGSLALPAAANNERCQDTALYSNMEDMRSAMRNLSFEFRANNLANALEHAEALLVASQASADEQPFRTQQLNETRQAEFLSQYQAEIQRMVELAQDLRDQLASEDSQAARQTLASIDNHSRSSHRQFKARGCN